MGRKSPSTVPVFQLPPEGEAAKDRILDAAHRLVGEKGPHAASIREIAKASGTNVALLYYYFGNKDGLLRAVVERNADRVAGFLREIAATPGTPRQQLLSFGDAWIEIAFSRQRFMAPWFRQTILDPGPVGDSLRVRVTRNVDLLASILEAGCERGQLRRPPAGFRLVALSLMTSLMGIAMELPLPHHLVGIDLGTDEARRKYLESMIDLFLSSLETV
jgi:AcrR family transcriptional regulator